MQLKVVLVIIKANRDPRRLIRYGSLAVAAALVSEHQHRRRDPQQEGEGLEGEAGDLEDGAPAGEGVAADVGEEGVRADGEGEDGGDDADGDVAGDVVPPAAVDGGVADDDEEAEGEGELEAADGEEEVGLGEGGAGDHGCDGVRRTREVVGRSEVLV